MVLSLVFKLLNYKPLFELKKLNGFFKIYFNDNKKTKHCLISHFKPFKIEKVNLPLLFFVQEEFAFDQ